METQWSEGELYHLEKILLVISELEHIVKNYALLNLVTQERLKLKQKLDEKQINIDASGLKFSKTRRWKNQEPAA